MSNATRLKWRGRWDQLIGRIKMLLGILTNNERMWMEGEYSRTIGWYEERAGERHERIFARQR